MYQHQHKKHGLGLEELIYCLQEPIIPFNIKDSDVPNYPTITRADVCDYDKIPTNI